MLWVFLTVLLTTALLGAQRERAKRRAALPPPDDPRWADAPRKQIAGRKCIECGVKIVTANEGAPCDICDEIAHVESCLEQHARSAHRAEPHVPYR